ncbi:MAG: hypothetical protein ACR2H0_04035 [Candidatus Limnocylindrales bacterium]
MIAWSAAVAPITGRAAEATDVNSLALSATYTVEATFGWEDRRASVHTVAIVTNTARWPVSMLAFNLATLRTGRAEVGAVTVDGAAAEAVVDDQTIVVPIAAGLGPGETTTVAIDYTARFAARSSSNSDTWAFARIGEVLTAYRWIPWLSRSTPFDRPNVGDPFVTASSPRVTVSITTDREITYAATGQPVGKSGLTQAFEATDVRDFNLAASPSYRTRSVAVAGIAVTFFYRTLPPDPVLETAARALRDYADKIGPYPHAQLTIAEIGPWSPFESPAHFWLPDNAPARLLPWMVAHEVAHEWFYSAVGNDQAREPFADEAVSDFMARSLISSFVGSQCPVGRLDHTIYDIGECYPWVIYVQGVAWLRDLRDRIGGEAFWDALAGYYESRVQGIGGTHQLIAELASATGAEAVDYRRFPRLYPPLVASMPYGPLLR